jgi:stress-induced morphogen
LFRFLSQSQQPRELVNSKGSAEFCEVTAFQIAFQYISCAAWRLRFNFKVDTQIAMTSDQMKSRLEKAYPGDPIEVVDLTGTHDHYQVMIVSNTFRGLTRIQQHKHVMSVFADELKTGEVHALTIQTKLPEAEA